MVLEALSAVNQEPPHALRNAHDRMAPMLRFFRHGDGALALFNGGAEGDPRMIAGLLARDEMRGQPFHHARHSGYQRLAAARTLLLLDCGQTPQGAFCAGRPCRRLRLRTSAPGHDRIVVNCGAGGADASGLERGAARHRRPFHPDAGRHLQRPYPAGRAGARPAGAAAAGRAGGAGRRAGWKPPRAGRSRPCHDGYVAAVRPAP